MKRLFKSVYLVALVIAMLTSGFDNGSSAPNESEDTFDTNIVCPAEGMNTYGEPNRGTFYSLHENGASAGMFNQDLLGTICPAGWHVPSVYWTSAAKIFDLSYIVYYADGIDFEINGPKMFIHCLS